jgi:hypothetical protein
MKIESTGLAGKKFNHEGEILVGRAVEAIELFRPIAPLAGLISACIEKCFKSPSKRRIHHFDAERHVDVLGRSEIDTAGRVSERLCWSCRAWSPLGCGHGH